MHRRDALVSLGLLGSAGCLRLQGRGDGATPTGRRTAGDDAPSTPTPTSTEVTYPTGLSAEGVTSFLYATHVRALGGTSFRARWTKLDRSHGTVKWDKEYRGDRGVALGGWSRENGARVDAYRSARGNYWREQYGDGVTYGDDHDGRDPELWGREIGPFLEAADWDPPTRVDDGGPVRWEVTADAVDDPSAIPGFHTGEVLAIAEATMTVDGDGVIRSLAALYRIRTSDGEELAYETRYEVDSIGQVSVDEPPWLADARERAPTATATFADDRQYVRLVVESGNRLEPGTSVFVGEDGTTSHFGNRLEDPIEPGTPVYLYKPAGSPDTGGVDAGVSVGRLPTGASPETLDGSYSLGARRWTTHYFDRVPVG